MPPMLKLGAAAPLHACGVGAAHYSLLIISQQLNKGEHRVREGLRTRPLSSPLLPPPPPTHTHTYTCTYQPSFIEALLYSLVQLFFWHVSVW